MQNETMLDVAVSLYTKQRKNCAEAVAGAWQTVTGKDLELDEHFSMCGSGRAPQGLCGAIYAAQLAADADKKTELTQHFADAAGSLLCREIRSMKKLSCLACVELAASMLEENLHQEVA